jgi:hypothetical protein
VRVLTDIDDGKDVLFRVLVVDESEHVGKIVASSKSIGPNDDEGSRKSLLPLQWKDIGEEIWRLRLGEGDRPHLVLNSRISESRDKIMTNPMLKGSIYPHALRGVLRFLYAEEPGPDDDEDWVRDWKRFVVSLVGEQSEERLSEEENDAADLRDLIEEVVVAFTNRGRFAEKFVAQERRLSDG